MKKLSRSLLAFAVLVTGVGLGIGPGIAWAEEAPSAPLEKRAGWDFRDLALTPVLAGGRLKPLDSLARESVLYLTGSRSFQNWKPVEMFVSILAHPKEWEQVELIKISRSDVKRQLLLEEGRTRFTVRELFQNNALLQYAQRMGGNLESQMSKAPDPKANPREEELKRLLDRLQLFQQLISGQAWVLIPNQDPNGAWQSIAEEAHADERSQPIRQAFIRMIAGYFSKESEVFSRAAKDLRSSVEKQIPGATETQSQQLKAEEFYNRVHPFLWSWILYVVAAIALTVGLWVGTAARVTGWVSLAGAFSAHVFGFGLRCFIAGRPPVTNMYESIVWVAFGAVTFSIVIYLMQRQLILPIIGAVLGALGLIAADSAPTLMDPGIHPLMAVLRSNYWLTVHVLTITLGYSAFALTLGLGNVTLYKFLQGASNHSPDVQRLNQLTYRAMQFGVVLLAAGTILGGIWADASWGRFWGWDPKEVWALIALLTYLTVLHGRYAGWVGPFGFAAWTVVCFSSVVMAWYGVNFVLGQGKHSYGFSAGGRGTVGLVVLIQLLFVVGVAWLKNRKRASAPT